MFAPRPYQRDAGQWKTAPIWALPGDSPGPVSVALTPIGRARPAAPRILGRVQAPSCCLVDEWTSTFREAPVGRLCKLKLSAFSEVTEASVL